MNRIGAVDSLRGWAILGVIAVHTGMLATPSSQWLSSTMTEGARGVELFYIVSTFSLFASYFERAKNQSFSLSGYFLRRFFRIAPMFWIAILLYLWRDGLAPRYWAPDGISGTDILLTTLSLHGVSAKTINAIVPGGWSIAVETSFYLVLPFLFKYVRSLRGALIVVFLTLAAGGVLTAWYVSDISPQFPQAQSYLPHNFVSLFWLPAQLPVFSLGLVLFFLFRYTEASESGSNPEVGWLWVLVALALMAAFSNYVQAKWLPNHFLFGIAFMLFSLGLLTHRIEILDNRIIQFIGRVSYSIYLLHEFVIGCVSSILQELGIAFGRGDAAYASAFLVVTVLATMLSAATYYLVELPFMRMAGRIAHGPEKPVEVSAQSEIQA